MKEVVVHPERCMGCMQCMVACATAHSQTKNLFTAILEEPLPKPRVHVGVGLYGEGFPNRCRHCNPSPCIYACLSGAVFRDSETDTVLIDADRCINCASCAMACPFGVIRYHKDCSAPLGKTVAIKCDNCRDRQLQGLIPSCVEACKSNALTFEESAEAMKRKTDEVARSISVSLEKGELSLGFEMLNSIKRKLMEMKSV